MSDPRRSHIDDKIERLASRAGPLDAVARSRALGPNEIAKSCTAKDRYPTREAARAFALMNGMVDALIIYECEICSQWHFTRRHKPATHE